MNGATGGKREEPVRLALGALAVAAAGALFLAERRHSLRAPRRTHDRDTGDRARARGPRAGSARIATNLALAGITTAVTQVAMTPVIGPLARWVERERAGLTQRLPLPAWARDMVAIVLLDYTLYLWHVAEHRVALLYRFHQVHHADLELDMSTAARFHAGEFLASVPWRAAQVALIGASERAVRSWQRLTMLSVLFHHSNVRLPIRVERALARIVVTPRLHGIHHSIVRDEQDSNWSSGLTVWDRLHGTYRGDVPQRDIEIGVPARRDPADVTLRRSMAMPFEPLPPWELPDGSVPRRPKLRSPRTRLLA